jgi:hypothetical protein
MSTRRLTHGLSAVRAAIDGRERGESAGARATSTMAMLSLGKGGLPTYNRIFYEFLWYVGRINTRINVHKCIAETVVPRHKKPPLPSGYPLRIVETF